MKFGKQLLTVIEACDEEWAPYWIDYRALKKLIKEITKKNLPQNETRAEAKENVFIMKSADEIDFFKALKSHLANASQFFDQKNQEMKERKDTLEGEFKALQTKTDLTEGEVGTFLGKIAKYYRELLLFESFRIFNFYGFSKILKKHDRWTGYSTKEKFMGNLVETHAFARQQDLRDLLEDTKSIYERATMLNRQRFQQAESEKQVADYVVSLEKAKTLRLEASMLYHLKKRPLSTDDDAGGNSSSEDDGACQRKKMQRQTPQLVQKV